MKSPNERAVEYNEKYETVARITNGDANIKAFNDVFSLNNTIILQKEEIITPTMSNLLLDSIIQMKSLELNPFWSSLLSAIVPIITNFYLHAKKQGTVTISNGKNVKTNLSVVKIDTCELDPLTTNTIRVRHVMNIETLDYNLVIKPEDIDLEYFTSRGSINPVVNKSILFCIYT